MSMRGERGAGTIEYVGLVVVITGLVGTLIASGVAGDVAGAAEAQMCRVVQPGTDCGTPGGRAGDGPGGRPGPEQEQEQEQEQGPGPDLYGNNLRAGPSHQDVAGSPIPQPFDQSVAALAARDPDAIQRLITDNGDGTYTVTFYGEDGPVPVTVDGPAAGELPPGAAAWPTIMGRAWDQFTQTNYVYGWGDEYTPREGEWFLGHLTDEAAWGSYPVPDMDEVRATWDAGSPLILNLTTADWRAPDQRPAWMFSDHMVVTSIDPGSDTVMAYDPRVGGEPRPIPWSGVQEYMDVHSTGWVMPDR